MHDSQRHPDVRIRTEGSDIVVTLDPQQAYDLARVIEQSSAVEEQWGSAAKTMRATATELAPDRGVSRRRALRLPGYSAVPRVPHVQSARPRATTPPPPMPRSTPRTVGGQPVTRRESLRTAATGPATRHTASPSTSGQRSAASGSGLAAAVAVFADAIAVGTETRPVPPAKPPRKAVTAEERARHLQEVLDAAAATSRDTHVDV